MSDFLHSPTRHVDLQRRKSHAATVIALTLLLIASASGLLLPRAWAEKSGPARRVLVTVKPQYPALLKYQQIGGLVRLVATVLADGTVKQVEVRGGNPILAESATAAVMKWKYAPGPSETHEEVSLSFSPH